jgi:hypothetical protein
MGNFSSTPLDYIFHYYFFEYIFNTISWFEYIYVIFSISCLKFHVCNANSKSTCFSSFWNVYQKYNLTYDELLMKIVQVCSFIGSYILHKNIMCYKHVWHINKCVDKWNTNLWMNECHMNVTSSYKSMF